MHQQRDHGSTSRPPFFVRADDLWRPKEGTNWFPPQALMSSYGSPPKPPQPPLLSLASNNYMPAPPRTGLTRFVSTHTRAILRSAPDRALSDPRQAVTFNSHPPSDASQSPSRLQLPPLQLREQRTAHYSTSPSPRTAAAEAGAKRVRKLIEAFESKPPGSILGDSTIASRAELVTRTPPISKTTFGGSHFRDELKPVLSLDLSEKGKAATRYVQLMFDDSAALEVLARTTQGESMIFRTASADTRFRIIIEPMNDPVSTTSASHRERFSARRRRADEHLTSAHISVEPTPAPSYSNTPHSTRRRHRATSLEMPARVDELIPLDPDPNFSGKILPEIPPSPGTYHSAHRTHATHLQFCRAEVQRDFCISEMCTLHCAR